MLTEKLMRLTVAGGSEWVMWLLIALSVISIAVIVERFMFFLTMRQKLDAIDSALTPLLTRGEDESVQRVVEKTKNTTLIAAMSTDAARPVSTEASEKLIASELSRERLRYEKRLGFLGTLGSNAPFIGLFGTVLGIIRAFHDLSLDNKGGSSTVMAGISEALVATAIGLFVAIPAVMAFNYFQRELDHVISVTESLAHSILARRLSPAMASGHPFRGDVSAPSADEKASKSKARNDVKKSDSDTDAEDEDG
jgi:biopolymer transport protein ExbB